MTVLGLDLSSTSTGICTGPPVYCLTVRPKGSLLNRARAMRVAIKGYAAEADLIVIEAVGTRHVQTAIAIATVHALVLDAIDTRPILIVSPAQLKRWATGKGNADKTTMVVAAMRNGWAPPSAATDDACDAWWLWTLGCARVGTPVVTATEYRAQVLADIDKAGKS